LPARACAGDGAAPAELLGWRLRLGGLPLFLRFGLAVVDVREHSLPAAVPEVGDALAAEVVGLGVEALDVLDGVGVRAFTVFEIELSVYSCTLAWTRTCSSGVSWLAETK